MTPSLDLETKLDNPAATQSLVDFKKTVMDAVARHDEALFDHLSQDFKVCDHGAFLIGAKHICELSHNHDVSEAAEARRTQK